MSQLAPLAESAESLESLPTFANALLAVWAALTLWQAYLLVEPAYGTLTLAPTIQVWYEPETTQVTVAAWALGSIPGLYFLLDALNHIRFRYLTSSSSAGLSGVWWWGR